MASSSTSTHSTQDCLLPSVTEEDIARINALSQKFSKQQLFALFASSRLSGSSFGTRSNTPSTWRTSSSFGFHSSENASLRSSGTSFLSADIYGSPKAPLSATFGSLSSIPDQRNDLYGNDDFVAMPLAGPTVGTWTNSATDEMPTAAKELPAVTWRCMYPEHEKFTTARKGDWVRHMDDFHKPGPFAWTCQIKGCGRRFETAKLFCQHHRISHQCRPCTHADESSTGTGTKLAFACGFATCSGLFDDWARWRDHISDHLLRGASVKNWNYSVEFRNLLRRGEVNTQWDRHVIDQFGADERYQHSFHWEPSTTGRLKMFLEYDSLQHNQEELVTAVFAAAVSMRTHAGIRNQSILSANAVPDMSLSYLSADAHTYSGYNTGISPLFSGLEGPYLPQMPAQALTSDRYHALSHQFPNQQHSHSSISKCTYNSASQIIDNSSWVEQQFTEPSLSYSATAPQEPEPSHQPPLDFWYPSVPGNPTAAYGLPDDAKQDMQHSRTKSSSGHSLKKMLSSIFSNKSGHSRSGSDDSDQQMGGAQTS